MYSRRWIQHSYDFEVQSRPPKVTAHLPCQPRRDIACWVICNVKNESSGRNMQYDWCAISNRNLIRYCFLFHIDTISLDSGPNKSERSGWTLISGASSVLMSTVSADLTSNEAATFNSDLSALNSSSRILPFLISSDKFIQQTEKALSNWIRYFSSESIGQQWRIVVRVTLIPCRRSAGLEGANGSIRTAETKGIMSWPNISNGIHRIGNYTCFEMLDGINVQTIYYFAHFAE